MIYIHVAGCCPCCAIIWTEPTSTRARTRIVRYHVRPVALEHLFARITRSGLCDPVRKQVAGVSCLRALCGDSQTGELSAGLGGGRDIWGSAGNERGGSGGDEGDGCEGKEDCRLHGCCVVLVLGKMFEVCNEWAGNEGKIYRRES